MGPKVFFFYKGILNTLSKVESVVTDEVLSSHDCLRHHHDDIKYKLVLAIIYYSYVQCTPCILYEMAVYICCQCMVLHMVDVAIIIMMTV